MPSGLPEARRQQLHRLGNLRQYRRGEITNQLRVHEARYAGIALAALSFILKLADCYAIGGIDEATSRAAGVGVSLP